MDWASLFDYLGAGGGLLVILNWLIALPAARKKARMDKDDVARHMETKDNQTIVGLYDQIREFQERMARLEGCVAKMVVCPHYDRCPARHVVQEYKRDYFSRYAQGQPGMGQTGQRLPRSDTGKVGDDGDPDGQPP